MSEQLFPKHNEIYEEERTGKLSTKTGKWFYVLCFLYKLWNIYTYAGITICYFAFSETLTRIT